MIVPFSRRKPLFWIGDIVYLIVADEEERGIVTSVDFKEASELYQITWGSGGVTYHSEFELTREFIPTYRKQED